MIKQIVNAASDIDLEKLDDTKLSAGLHYKRIAANTEDVD